MGLTRFRKMSSDTDSVFDYYDYITFGGDISYDFASIYKLFDSNYSSDISQNVWSLKFGGKPLKCNSNRVI